MTNANSAQVDLIKNANAAFARGDIETLLSGLAPEFEWIEPPGSLFAGTYRTRDELIQKYFMKLAGEFDIQLHAEDYIESGNTVVVRGRHETTHRPTGKKVTTRYVTVNEFVNGKVARFEHFTDTSTYRQLAGR
jgi:ketosteroid isomerase-like protein